LPNIKAAEKWAKQSEKREQRNKGAKSRLKTLFKKAVESSDAADGKVTESAYDRAAAKGIIHPNKAARKKSRLAKAMKRAATPVAAKSTKSAKKTSKKASRKKSS
jgi:small subunit ribosomal protein S20